MEIRMNPNLKCYFSKTKMIKMSLISIPLILIGVLCFSSNIMILNFIGIVEIILGISTLLIGLKSLLNKNPQIVMDQNGIIDHRILKKTIRWNQIRNFELTIINNQKFLKLQIPDNFSNDNFKWLFLTTSKLKLNKKPKNVLINLDQLKIDYKSLNDFLVTINANYKSKNLDKNLTGFGNLINKILY